MKLHWFSPLPPARTGIAAYAEAVLPELARRAQVTVWTEQTDTEALLEGRVEVRRYGPDAVDWAALNRADAAIYHIGNDQRFHAGIWQVSQRHPGVVVLHDLRLQHLIAGVYRQHWNDRKGYLDLMERCYGRPGRQDAESFWDGWITTEFMATQYPLTELATSKALGVLVHSHEAHAELARGSLCSLVNAPLPYPPPRAGARHARPGREPVRLVLMGHIGANRRVESVLAALADLEERKRFQLDIVGEVQDRQQIERAVGRLDLEGIVHIHGFVRAEQLRAILDSAHLALNLRYPTMGEASLSQLQLWEHGLPTLVTRVGWYASLPQTAVAFVSADREIEDIRSWLRAYLADPERFALMGLEGRRLLELSHGAGDYVTALLGLVEQARVYRSREATLSLTRRVASELSGWTGLTRQQLVGALRDQRGKAQLTHDREADPLGAAISRHLAEMRLQHRQVLRALEDQTREGSPKGEGGPAPPAPAAADPPRDRPVPGPAKKTGRKAVWPPDQLTVGKEEV